MPRKASSSLGASTWNLATTFRWKTWAEKHIPLRGWRNSVEDSLPRLTPSLEIPNQLQSVPGSSPTGRWSHNLKRMPISLWRRERRNPDPLREPESYQEEPPTSTNPDSLTRAGVQSPARVVASES